MTNKELVIDAVQELADDATLQEFADRVAILAAIREGEEAADAGRVITHEELKRRMSNWTSQ